MRLGTKITLGYLLLIALMGSVLLYELRLVSDLQSLNRQLLTVNYEAGKRTLRLLNSLYELDSFTRVYFVRLDSEYVQELRQMLASFSSDLAELRTLDLSLEEKRVFRDLSVSWDEFSSKLNGWLNSPGRAIPAAAQEGLATQLSQLEILLNSAQAVSARAVETQVELARTTGDRAQIISLAAAALGVSIAILIALGVVRSITRPLNELTQGTRLLAEGDFTFRANQSGGDEVAQLARNFNSMVRRLDELDQLKKDFVSHVSHELKAPLASMQETTSLLLEEIPGALNPKQARLLDLNRKCGRRLSAMINNLLDVSRLESGLMEYEFEPTDLSSLVSSVQAEIETSAAERNCPISLRLPDAPVIVFCDEQRIVQVVRNLLDNALKFSVSGNEILVTVDRRREVPLSVPPEWASGLPHSSEGFGLITFEDSGPGIADEHKRRIFSKFHQVKSGQKISGQGVGLGLAISRTIIESHNGAIWVEDREGLQGSRFCVLLSAAKPQKTHRVSAPV